MKRTSPSKKLPARVIEFKGHGVAYRSKAYEAGWAGVIKQSGTRRQAKGVLRQISKRVGSLHRARQGDGTYVRAYGVLNGMMLAALLLLQ